MREQGGEDAGRGRWVQPGIGREDLEAGVASGPGQGVEQGSGTVDDLDSSLGQGLNSVGR
jgi:hypothetical protein